MSGEDHWNGVGPICQKLADPRFQVTANYICEIHCLALDRFISKLPTNLAVKRKISAELGFEPRAAGWEARMHPLCYTAPPQLIVT